jgi:hypothetical protein
MGMLGLTLLIHIAVITTHNNFSRKVCKQDFLGIRMRCSQEFSGNGLVRARDFFVEDKTSMAVN